MTERPLRVAILGAGMIANAGHVPAWQHAGAEIVAIQSRTLSKAQETARREGIPHAYDDWRALLAEQAPDVVSICTPNSSHAELTIAALEAGAHVLCEKPVATTYADALAMFQAAERAGRVLMVGQSGRFGAEIQAAKRLVEGGQLGEIYYAETSALRRRGVPQWGRFHMRADSGGGALIDIGVHALDALLWLMGNPAVVATSGLTYCKLANQDEGLVTSLADSGAPLGVFAPRAYDWRELDVEDLGVGLLRLADGASITLRASWAANVPPGMGGTLLLGTVGGLRLSPLTLIGRVGAYQADSVLKVPPDPQIPFHGTWRAAEHLTRVIRGQEALLVRREEVLNVIGALEGLYRSAALGREVRLDEFKGGAA
jgi:predicted dehydrogenase